MLQFKKVMFKFSRTSWDCNFSFKLNSGDSLGIIGPSGSGKSTLLNLLAGFIKPTSGSIFNDMVDYTNKAPRERPITMLFQEHNLFDHLNIFQNIAIGINPSLNLNKEEIDEVNRALDRVGLGGFNKRYTSQLSGGQKQRIAIARSLVRKTSILILDEPFSYLDPPFRIEMLDLVKELQKERKFTLLMVTHDFNDCLRICNKSAFIDHGKIVHFDSTKSFANNIADKPKIKTYLAIPIE